MQGYFFKAGALGSDWVTVADVAEVVVQAQVAQSLGLRILYLFPVTVRSPPVSGSHRVCVCMHEHRPLVHRDVDSPEIRGRPV